VAGAGEGRGYFPSVWFGRLAIRFLAQVAGSGCSFARLLLVDDNDGRKIVPGCFTLVYADPHMMAAVCRQWLFAYCLYLSIFAVASILSLWLSPLALPLVLSFKVWYTPNQEYFMRVRCY
jgi:hypothetical protein